MNLGVLSYQKYFKYIQDHNDTLSNNYLDILPNEILKYIYLIVERDAGKIICKNLKKLREIKNTYYSEFFKLSNLYILNRLYVEGDVNLIQPNLIVINAFSKKTHFILKNLSKFLNGKEDKKWLYLFIYLINSILHNTNIFHNNGELNSDLNNIMLANEHLLCKLLVKFNLFPSIELSKEYYWVFYLLPDNFIDIIDIQRRKKGFDLNNLRI